MARRVGRHVGHHHVGRAAEQVHQLLGRALVEKVELDEFDARHGIDVAGGRCRPPAPSRPTFRGGDLRPAARRGAEIDDALAGLEQIVLLVDLQQLEGRPRAITLALRPRDIGIVELALEPYLRRSDALVGGLHPLLQVAGARAGLAAVIGYAPRRQTPSSRIMFIRIPSRRPRSAMRRRSDGKRHAGSLPEWRSPPRTRSARSRPMHGIGGPLRRNPNARSRSRTAGHLRVAHPHAVDAPPVIALQPEVDAADGGHRAGRAEQVEIRAPRRDADAASVEIEREDPSLPRPCRRKLVRRHVDAAMALGQGHHADRAANPRRGCACTDRPACWSPGRRARRSRSSRRRCRTPPPNPRLGSASEAQPVTAR